MQTKMAPEGVEPMEDVEEEKALPPDQTPSTGHGENDDGGSKNNIPSQNKKRNIRNKEYNSLDKFDDN